MTVNPKPDQPFQHFNPVISVHSCPFSIAPRHFLPKPALFLRAGHFPHTGQGISFLQEFYIFVGLNTEDGTERGCMSAIHVFSLFFTSIYQHIMSGKTFNTTEREERKYLEEIKERLQQAINEADAAVGAQALEIMESKDYLWENRDGMDHVEKVAVKQSITQIALSGENAAELKKRLAKLLSNHYFGRIDFAEENAEDPEPFYIGTFSFYDQQRKENLVYDWRAPVTGMFYDFELGKAFYESPAGYFPIPKV